MKPQYPMFCELFLILIERIGKKVFSPNYTNKYLPSKFGFESETLSIHILQLLEWLPLSEDQRENHRGWTWKRETSSQKLEDPEASGKLGLQKFAPGTLPKIHFKKQFWNIHFQKLLLTNTAGEDSVLESTPSENTISENTPLKYAFSNVMSPHHSDNSSLRSKVSWVAT